MATTNRKARREQARQEREVEAAKRLAEEWRKSVIRLAEQKFMIALYNLKAGIDLLESLPRQNA